MVTKKLIRKIPLIDMNVVTRLSRYANLRDIYLLKSMINSDYSTRSPNGAQLEHKYEVETINRKGNESISVDCKFSVSAYHKEASNNIIMSIEATYLLKYSFENLEQIKTDDIDNFIEIDPLLNAFPYWREFVQNMTARMGFPVLTLSTLKTEFKDKPFSKKGPKGSKLLKGKEEKKPT